MTGAPRAWWANGPLPEVTHVYEQHLFPDRPCKGWPIAKLNDLARHGAEHALNAHAAEHGGWVNPDMITVHPPGRPLDPDKFGTLEIQVVVTTAPICLGPPSL